MFHHHTTVLINNDSQVLLRALDRWSISWEAALRRVDNEEQRWLGVVKYSAGIELLSRRILEVSNSEVGKQSPYLQRIITYNTAALYQFMQLFCINVSKGNS